MLPPALVGQTSTPRFEVSKDTALTDAAIGITLTGLPPRQRVTIRLDGNNGSFSPSAVYMTDAQGALDLSRMEDKDVQTRAEIPVERINGPVLLLSGKEDSLWPSALMAAREEARLKRQNFRFPVQHYSYEHAGHAIGRDQRLIRN